MTNEGTDDEEEDPYVTDDASLLTLPNHPTNSHFIGKSLLMSLGNTVVDSMVANRQRWTRLSLTAVQYSLIWFLLKSLWNAMKETMDELSQEGLMGSGGDSSFCSRSEVARLITTLVQQQQQQPPNNSNNRKNKNSHQETNTSLALLPRAVLQLARDLMQAGIPLQAHPSLGRSSIESLFQDMTKSEAAILQQCLWRPPLAVRQHPDELWDAVLGLDDVKENILLTVAATTTTTTTVDGGNHNNNPMGGNSNTQSHQSHLHRTQQAYASLLSSTSGVSSTSTSQHHGMLLYGEPGCGKSYFIQALASKLRVPCLVVTPSVLMRKYVGETNLQVRSLFSLLQNKLFPCILVLDELDGLFRERHDSEHDASRELKTEFLQWLSGIMTTSSSSSSSSSSRNNQQQPGATTTPRHPLIVIGATNRPLDVDSAILRRLPQRFYVGLPNFDVRCQLIEKMLQNVPLSNDFQVDVLGQQTEGYTPSDIRQVLQTAARLGPIKDALILGHERQQQLLGLQLPGLSSESSEVRPLTTRDVQQALSQVGPTPLSPSYKYALQQFATSNGASVHHHHSPQQNYAHNGYPLQGNLSGGVHFMNIGTVQAPLWNGASTQESSTSNNWDDLEGTNSDNDGDDDGDFYDNEDNYLDHDSDSGLTSFDDDDEDEL